MPIQLKRSAVAGKVPTTAQLSLGELAVNTRDGRLFLKKDNGTEDIIEFVSSEILHGQVAYFAMTTAPTGWLKCNGAAISRTTYADLFAALGTTFGAGNGSTTFNLPDLRGEFIRVWDDGRGVDPSRSFGSFQSDEFRSHNHGIMNLGTSGSTSGITDGSFATSSGFLSTLFTGGSETRPRNRALLACIKY